MNYKYLFSGLLSVLIILTSGCSSTSETQVKTVKKVVLYASEKQNLNQYDLDTSTGELTLRSRATFPQQVQYAVADPTNSYLYVSASDFNANHMVAAFKIDPKTGALAQHGDAIIPPGRVIHLSTDGNGKYLAMAHNQTRQFSILSINPDGTLGKMVPQKKLTADAGFFPHQAKMIPGDYLVVSALGADPKPDGSPEELGQLSLFKLEDGVASPKQAIVYGPGVGFRHIDVHPSKAVIYSAVERSNQLMTYTFKDSTLTQVSALSSLADPKTPKQRTGAIHVHPSGKYLYLSNRNNTTAETTVSGSSVQVSGGGDNDITLFSIEDNAANPIRIANYDSRGFEPRTFSIDPTGKFLIVGNQIGRNVLKDGAVATVSPNIAVFSIGSGGKLNYLRKYDVKGGDVFWVGAVALP